jgi:ADP-heptose:LPS heptosyltransferase
MFRWFAPFWSGQETLGFVERHTRFAIMVAPTAALPVTLPREYAAVKLYSARSLPDQPDVRAQLRWLVESLADRLPVVYLDTGLGIDDHADYALGGSDRVVSLTGRLSAETNLAVQTQIVAGARLFVGTCGSLAWLAPLLGVPTVPLFTDAAFLHAHLHVARRVYGRVGAGPFSPVDLSGIMNAGLTIGAGNDVAVNGRRS